MDERASHVTAIKTALHTVFPQYLDIFSDILGTTSKMILRQYPTPEKLLRGHKKTMIEKISIASRKGLTKATERYEKLIHAATCPQSGRQPATAPSPQVLTGLHPGSQLGFQPLSAHPPYNPNPASSRIPLTHSLIPPKSHDM